MASSAKLAARVCQRGCIELFDMLCALQDGLYWHITMTKTLLVSVSLIHMQCSGGAAAALCDLVQIGLDQRPRAPARQEQYKISSKKLVTSSAACELRLR